MAQTGFRGADKARGRAAELRHREDWSSRKAASSRETNCSACACRSSPPRPSWQRPATEGARRASARIPGAAGLEGPPRQCPPMLRDAPPRLPHSRQSKPDADPLLTAGAPHPGTGSAKCWKSGAGVAPSSGVSHLAQTRSPPGRNGRPSRGARLSGRREREARYRAEDLAAALPRAVRRWSRGACHNGRRRGRARGPHLAAHSPRQGPCDIRLNVFRFQQLGHDRSRIPRQDPTSRG